MSKDKKSIFNTQLNMSPSPHATLLVVIGGYLVYLAYQMVRDTMSGVSAMSMTTTAILAGLMALAGLAVFGYGAWEALRSWKATKEKSIEETKDEE